MTWQAKCGVKLAFDLYRVGQKSFVKLYYLFLNNEQQ